MASQRALSMALVGLGCALAGAVLGWQAREAHVPAPAPEEASEPPAAVHAPSVHGLELLPPKLEVGLTGPWREAARALPAVLVADLGPLREWHAGFHALNAEVERPPPLGPALAEAFLATPELFLTRHASRFDVPAWDLFRPRPGAQKGQDTVASPKSKSGRKSSAAAKLLALCGGLSMTACSAVQVRAMDEEWLENCSDETIAIMREKGIQFGIPYFTVVEVSRTWRHGNAPWVMYEGLVVGESVDSMGLDTSPNALRLRRARMFGRAKLYGDRMSIRIDRIRFEDDREIPVCGVGYDAYGQQPGLERYGPDSHVGQPGDKNPEALAWVKTLEPHEFPISGLVRVSFGTPLRPEHLRGW